MRPEVDLLNSRRPDGMTCEEIQKHLAGEGVAVTRQAIEHWLAGRRNLSLFYFERLASLFELPKAERAAGRRHIIARLNEPRRRAGAA